MYLWIRVDKEENNKTMVQFVVSGVSIKIYPDSLHFPNASCTWTIQYNQNMVMLKLCFIFVAGEPIEGKFLSDSLFVTNMNHSYRCYSEEVVTLTVHEYIKALVQLTRLQLEAFRSHTDVKFSAGKIFHLINYCILNVA